MLFWALLLCNNFYIISSISLSVKKFFDDIYYVSFWSFSVSNFYIISYYFLLVKNLFHLWYVIFCRISATLIILSWTHVVCQAVFHKYFFVLFITSSKISISFIISPVSSEWSAFLYMYIGTFCSFESIFTFAVLLHRSEVPRNAIASGCSNLYVCSNGVYKICLHRILCFCAYADDITVPTLFEINNTFSYFEKSIVSNSFSACWYKTSNTSFILFSFPRIFFSV